ncbi:hypothetical protein LTR84_007006 [Exophiala bonariae]|uniref:FAD/NAD(P)-binding domain-containing protein n=1 Tax=Exophiala bonariae TaxID=1690606 RepID=A0AAV9N212_9EURO|nr:hypothetical protein LTR84_007006 [Exophiala bonariae]
MAIPNISDSSKNGLLKHARKTKVSDLPGSLPTTQIPADVDIEEVALSRLSRLLSLSEEDLLDSVIWRDSLALTGTFRTFYSARGIIKAWNNTFIQQSAIDLTLVPNTARLFKLLDESSWIDADFTFQSHSGGPHRRCSGIISISFDENKGWKIWMIRTTLEGIEGYGNVDVLDPVVSPEAVNKTTNGVDGRAKGETKQETTQHFDVIVVGGGQAGLGIGGRLQALNVSYLVIDKFEAVGDSWNSRYDSTKLHTAREFGHLPFYRTYDDSYPEFLTKGDIARGHQDYVNRFGINVWQSTELVSSSWSNEKRIWTSHLVRGTEDIILTTRHLVFASGSAGREPVMPSLPNQEQFKGLVLHSSDYHNSHQWKGLHGVVIGSANTGHDVADDMLNAGLSSVTMVQRSRTWVLPAEHYMVLIKASYNPDVPTEKADRENLSLPVSIRRQMAMKYLHTMARNDSERFDALEMAGFNVERYGDIANVLFDRLGGHYMDVGTSAKISQGLIRVRSGSPPASYTPDGLVLEDGTELKADVIVFTTGFVQNMRTIAGRIVGPEVEAQLKDFWGLNAEGELIGAFKYTGHPGVWYTGGDIGCARYFSRFVALQIKAQLMGTPLQLYEA